MSWPALDLATFKLWVFGEEPVISACVAPSNLQIWVFLRVKKGSHSQRSKFA